MVKFPEVSVDPECMAKSVPAALFKGEAYRIYCQEFELRLAELMTCLSGEPLLVEHSELSARFHKLKGGAGFFGLDQIYQTASELEQLFAGAPASKIDQTALQSAFDLLSNCRAQMPTPAEGRDA